MALGYNVCPYCGQTVFGVADEKSADEALAARMNCTCERAKEFQRQYEKSQQIMEKVDTLFGDGCETQNPVYKPLPPEILDEIRHIAEAVAFERIESAAISLPDDTKAKITYTTIERTKTIKSKLS